MNKTALSFIKVYKCISNRSKTAKITIMYGIEMCMGMGKPGIRWVSWHSHGYGN